MQDTRSLPTGRPIPTDGHCHNCGHHIDSHDCDNVGAPVLCNECRGRCIPDENEAAPRGVEYGRPTPMPVPAPDPTDDREPDAYGVSVGDLIAGKAADVQSTTVGLVVAIERPGRYRVRRGDVDVMGAIEERLILSRPVVIVPAGVPLDCPTCGGRHDSAARFIDCVIAHVRAARERVAAALA